MTPNHLRICIDGRLLTGQSGGVEQAIVGLASGFSQLNDGDEEYLFLVYVDESDWLRPYMGGPCKLLPAPYKTLQKVRRLVNSFPQASSLFRVLTKFRMNFVMKLPVSDGTIESARVDIMHFTFQSAFKTDVPSIYHPWDLQHVHLPSFFAEHERFIRDLKFRSYCDQAQMVSVASWWMKKEIVKHLPLSGHKVKVIPMAPPIDSYPVPTDQDLEASRIRFNLPESFLFYPAKTWGHKNHLRLCEALALLRQHYGLALPLICSGGTTPFFSKIQNCLRELNLLSQVKFIGFVSPLDLQCLYRLCRFMVFPSKYEGWGLPITEAMRLGVPIACSNIPVLKEQVDDAALLFDPEDPQRIADTMRRLWADEDLRHVLSKRGMEYASRYNWEKTARIFRAHYREIAGRPLTEEDQWLLTENFCWDK